MTGRQRAFDDHPIEAVKAIEQFGMVHADPDRDRKAALNVADWSLSQDNPEQVCAELLALLGLDGKPQPPAREVHPNRIKAPGVYEHGTAGRYKAGCTCGPCVRADRKAQRQRESKAKQRARKAVES